MSYPPQPPGQGGWGQPQQGPYRPPGGQYPPSGPFQPSGPFPPSGPQQAFGSQPPPGQFGGMPPQPGYGPPQGSPYGPGLPGPQPGWGPGPKKRSPLPWILGGGGGLVVLGIVAVVLFMVLGGSSPDSLAKKAVDLMNNDDTNGLIAISCMKDQAGLRQDAQNTDPSQDDPTIPSDIKEALKNVKPHFTLVSVTKDNDNHSTVRISYMYLNVPAKLPADLPPDFEQTLRGTQNFPPLEVIKENGDWKLCGLGQSGPSQSGN